VIEPLSKWVYPFHRYLRLELGKTIRRSIKGATAHKERLHLLHSVVPEPGRTVLALWRKVRYSTQYDFLNYWTFLRARYFT
jgi:hypothetical protein